MKLDLDLLKYNEFEVKDIYHCFKQVTQERKFNKCNYRTIEGQILICKFRFTRKEIHLTTERR